MELSYFSFVFIYLIGTLSASFAVSNELPDCSAEPTESGLYELQTKELRRRRDLLVVSTLDGRISALDPTEDGQLIWSKTTDPGALLSSDISNLELFNNGQAVQMIPSLDGNIYMFDGKKLEQIPVTMETLLQHSFKFGDGNVFTGGMETSTYGINPHTGELHYICGMSGCTNFGKNASPTEDVLLVKRRSKVLHCVDSRTGDEKWNISVGELQTSLIKGMEKGCGATHQLDDAEDVYIEDTRDYIWDNIQIKAFIPEGIIAAVQGDSGRPLWSYKMESPVVNLWKISNGAIEHIDLFDPNVFSIEQNAQKSFLPPLLYYGVHNNQPYIQHAPEMLKTVANSAAHSSGNPLLILKNIHWRPYLVTASSRTPHIHLGNHDASPIGGKNAKKTTTTALIIRSDQSEYPYDSGYYLYESKKVEVLPSDNASKCNEDDKDELTFQEMISGSIWDYWRQILAISIIFAVLANLAISALRKMHRRTINEISSSKESETLHSAELLASPTVTHIQTAEKSVMEEKSNEYTSRFLTDFDVVQCLGRGGFGIVYEARNKIDDCSYAVKRICLPNREDAREKVTREVKALAKLDHTSIVRYFHTWLEYPPSGWQENEDKILEISDTQSPAHVSASPHIRLKKLTNTLKVPGDINESYGFLVNELSENNNTYTKDKCDMGDDSDSSLEVVFQDSTKKKETKSSLSRTFLESDNSEEQNTSEYLPFKQYAKLEKSDASVVFQDSGCGDQPSSAQGTVSSSDSSSREKCVARKKSSESISRPNKLQIEDLASCRKAPKVYLYIQMQLCQKETLKDWLNNTPDRVREEVLDIFDQIVSAVEYVHEQGLMHRDLKPSNIFFSIDGWVKVGDFGLVTAMTESELHTPAGALPKDNSVMYHTNNVGTQLYMSPEQISGQAYNHKVDIFSLGIILFELLFPLNTHMERVQTLIGVKEQRFPKAFKEDNPEECALVEQLVSINPEDRPSASAIKAHHLFKEFQPHPHVPLRAGRRRTLSNRLSAGSEVELPVNNSDIDVCA